MSRQYPIWNAVYACHYNSGKSYGNKNTGEVNIYVGSSSSNSHHFVRHVTTKRQKTHPKYGQVWVFKFSVDDVVLKEMIFADNDGKPGKRLKTRTKMNSLKSL